MVYIVYDMFIHAYETGGWVTCLIPVCCSHPLHIVGGLWFSLEGRQAANKLYDFVSRNGAKWCSEKLEAIYKQQR